MHICPYSALQLSHYCCEQAPNATLLEQICSIDGDPELNNRYPIADKQVPQTLLRLCRGARQHVPDVKPQVSDADAQILRRSSSTVPTMLPSCPGHSAQVPDTDTQVLRRSSAVVLNMLRWGKCVAEQVKRNFSTIATSTMMYKFPDVT
jgi:hypothetical protein